MSCRDFTEFLNRYVAEQLSFDERLEFDAHLAVCPHCVRYLDGYRKSLVLVRASAASEPLEAMPEDLVKAILAACDKGPR